MLSTIALLLAVSAPLNNGPCLDSVVAVPHTLHGTGTSSEVVRIDKIVATSTMIEGEIIGYVYTRQDGTTYLGQRQDDYMSAADSTAINAVFNSTHMPNATVTQFPPERLYGVKTNYQQTFQVKIPQNAWDPLHIRIDPCVAWPAGQALPDPIP
ncbi:MAG TPA: hypothetical protein VIG51_12175 [Candidatus Baltobacteraceae bacterium]|jgi:hypothetical protein